MAGIILALDGMEPHEVFEFVMEVFQEEVKQNRTLIWGVKLNDALIKGGIDLMRYITSNTQFNIMCDLKLFDIPNTMHNQIDALIQNGADIITIHCASLYQWKHHSEYLAGVTVLTTFDELACAKVFYNGIDDTVDAFAGIAVHNGYRYLVCSPKDLHLLKEKNITKICPGIRPEWYQDEDDDQKRTMTPKEAMDAGADLLVIGRPIYRAKNPIKALLKTIKEIEE